MVSGVSRRTVLAAMTLPVLGSVAGCLGRDWNSFSSTTFTVGTGNPGGVFVRYGEALSKVVGRRLDGVAAKTQLTNASVQNLQMVAGGTIDIGFSLGDTAADALAGTGTFDQPLDVVALARTYDSFVHLVVREDSPIKTAADLRGRRIGVGAVGSGTRVIATRILEHAGMGLADIEVSSATLESSSAAVLGGGLDAFFFVSGLPNQAVLSLSEKIGIRLIGLRGAVESMVETYGPEYVAGPIPASVYGLKSAVDTVSVKNYIVAEGKMGPRLAYAVTRVMFEAQDEIDGLSPGVAQPGIGAAIFTSPLELHPGALRYYRERRG